MLTGTGPLTMGAVGEAWTSAELRPLRGRGWKLLDHVYYRFGDIDHVLVGPSGVIVVETKWSADPWVVDSANVRITDAVRQVQRNARDLRLTVPELRRRDGTVRSVLFLWGGARSGGKRPTAPVRIGDVEVVVGVAAAKTWRVELSAAAGLFEGREIQALWARLRTQAVNTDMREAGDPPPPSVARLYWTAVATLVAALTSLLAVIYTYEWTGTALASYCAAAIAVLVGVAARRIARLRYIALGWLAGDVVITIALIAAQLGV
jgi:hypothetical protein